MGRRPIDHRRSSQLSDRQWFGTKFDVKDFVKMDELFGMTNGRMIARFLSRFWFYNPYTCAERTGEGGTDPAETDALVTAKKKPSLDAAWAYFEHVTLPRRFVTEDGKEIHSAVDSIKAMPGESSRPTKLYNPFWTENSALADFGIGVGIYFSNLRAVAAILFVAAAIHIPNFIYFSSYKYSSHGQVDLPKLLRGSAICTDTEWVPCPHCSRDRGNDVLEELWTSKRVVASSFERNDGSTALLYFAQKNICGEGDYLHHRGVISFIGLVFLVVALLGLGEYQKWLEIKYDERNATCTDFSLAITNPPDDATDVDEWKKYLETVVHVYLSKQQVNSGDEPVKIRSRDKHVTCLTVALDNHVLTDALAERRLLKRKIKVAFGDVTQDQFEELYNDARSNNAVISTNSKVQSLFEKLVSLDGRIRDLETKRYNAARIFASFETEVGQRAALSALSVGRIQRLRKDTKALADERYAFRGKHILYAVEPTEPLTVRWHALGIPHSVKRRKRIVTFIISVLIIVGAFYLVKWVWLFRGPGNTALVIAVLNMLGPHLFRFINHLEVHTSEGKKQRSLFTKTLAFRWITSAFVIHLITPFAQSIAQGEHLIKAVLAIFIAEMWTAPLFQLLNIVGNIKRHILAPRKKDQESMNLMFNGGRCELAERYTNSTKLLFLCFFFSAVFPGAFVLAAVALLVHHEVDKFCLLRVWAPIPSLGAHVAVLNRTTITPILLIVLGVMNAYLWSGFPYDNICESPESVPGDYIGNHSLPLPGTEVSVEVGDSVYKSCSQDFLGRLPMVFPALPRFQGERWMSEGQEAIVKLHAWTSVAMIGIAVFYTLFVSEFSTWIVSLFMPTYEPKGDIYGVDFSDVPGEIFPAYVPQIKPKGFTHALVACDLANIDRRFVGWRDPDDLNLDYLEHNIFHDVSPEAAQNKDKPIFSVMRQWAPPATEVQEWGVV